MHIYPSILTSSLQIAQQQLDSIQDQDVSDVVQIDVIDGFFADDLTLSPLDLPNLHFYDFKCDLHLMVDEPMDYVYEAEGLKEHIPIRAVLAQVEHMSYQASFLEEVRKQAWLSGLSLDIHTPLEAIDEESWESMNFLQLMGNEAGKQGQPLHPALLPKLKQAREFIDRQKLNIEIIVDIGVNQDTIGSLIKAGAGGSAPGSAIWTASDPMAALHDLAAAT